LRRDELESAARVLRGLCQRLEQAHDNEED
jgi:hypothetical protein